MDQVEDGCLVGRSLDTLCLVVESGVVKEFKFCLLCGHRHTSNGVVGVIDKKSMYVVLNFKVALH